MAGKQGVRRQLMEILGGVVCADCGVTDFLLLDIHHERGNGALDRRNLGHGWERYYVDNPVLAKQAGLMVLCANCHRLRHRPAKPSTPKKITGPKRNPLTLTIHLKPGSRMPTPEELAEFLAGLKEHGKE